MAQLSTVPFQGRYVRRHPPVHAFRGGELKGVGSIHSPRKRFLLPSLLPALLLTNFLSTLQNDFNSSVQQEEQFD